MSTKGVLMLFIAPVVTAFFSIKRVLFIFTALLLMALPSVAAGFAAEIATTRTGLDEAGNVTIQELEFKNAEVQDAVRIISEVSGVNIAATGEAGKRRVTLFVRKQTVADIVDSICRISGLWYRHNPKSGIFIVMTTKEYQRDVVVSRDEPIRMFHLKYLNVAIAARTIADLFGDRVELGGRANWDTGDDYEIADLVSAIDENYGDDDDDTGSDRNRYGSGSNRRDRTDSGSRSRRDRTDEKKIELTPAQLALLEQRARTESQVVSEGALGQVSGRAAEAPIYVTVNRMHNMLFVRTSDEKAMEEIARVVKDSDHQVPEVLLEMKVLEVQLTDQFESAFDISRISGSKQTGPDDGQVVNPLNTAADTVGKSLLGLGNFGTIANSTLTFQYLSSDLRVRLQLLQQNNNITALATPMLLAANNHPARLFIGEETVLTTGYKSQEVSVAQGATVVVNTVPVPVTETRSVGNTLTILPSINADRSVVMRIVHENSTVKAGGGRISLLVDGAVRDVSIDTVNTSKLEGTVLAQDGMTVAVGGMMRTSVTDSETKVPVLGDIPGLGFFFKKKQKGKTKTELVLLITPHVLSAPYQGEAVTRRRLSELTKHPNEIDIYLDKLDRERSSGQPATGER